MRRLANFVFFLKLCWDSSFASRGLNVEDVSGGNPFFLDKGGESKIQVLARFLTYKQRFGVRHLAFPRFGES